MTIWKKALSVATTAALLASLLATAVAPAAFGSTTVTGVGTVPQGGTSATAATFVFTESDINTLTTAGGSFSVYIWDKTGDCTVAPGVGVNIAAATVHFTGTATQSGPGSMDLAPLVVGDNFFTVKTRNADPLNVESVTVAGLKIKADTTAQTGAIKACVYNDTGIFAAAFATGTATATGKLVGATGVNATSFNIAVDVGSCDFATLPNAGPPALGPIKIGTDSVTTATVSAKGASVVGQQDVTGAAPALAVTHGANDVVTEKVANCTVTTLGSPGTVAKSLRYLAPSQSRVTAGENNQLVADLSAKERDSLPAPGDGPAWTESFFTVGGTLTLTITTPGVTFSQAPLATATGGLKFTATPAASGTAYGTLSADRQSVAWKVDTKSTSAATITWSLIHYDVAASVATGTEINVTLAASDGAVAPTSRSNAVVGRVFNVTSTSPVVYIGENNQTAGLVTVAETAPAFFQAGGGANNTLVVCLRFNTFSNETFASAPWAKVTAGDLRLREGDVASPDNIVQAKPIISVGPAFDCYFWTVWTASTTASTIVLSSDEAGTVGLKINVPSGSPVGPVNMSVRTGVLNSNVFTMQLEAITQIAQRQFRSQVAVTALSQPFIPVGSNGSKAGDIQIQETANGQLKSGEFVCVSIVPNQNTNILFDAYLTGLNTADVPIVTASNGVLANAVRTSNVGCQGQNLLQGPLGNLIESFSFQIVQQSTTGTGKLVISNIKYATANDAVEGPVQVNVFGESDPSLGGTRIDFQSLISNAKIGAPAPLPTLSINATSALGNNPTSGYTTKTPKVQVVGKYITWKFTGGTALAGQRVNILVAQRINGAWGGSKYFVSRTADANGIVTFIWKSNSALVVNARAQWPGNASYTVSTSPALGAHWQ